MNTNYPLILVFYLDRQSMLDAPDVFREYAKSVTHDLESKGGNTLAYFLPTDGEERVECINPTIMDEPDMNKINQMVEDIKKNFDINPKIPDNE